MFESEDAQLRTPKEEKKDEERKRKIEETSPEEIHPDPKKQSDKTPVKTGRRKEMATVEEIKKLLKEETEKQTETLREKMDNLERKITEELRTKIEKMEKKIEEVEESNEILFETNKKMEEKMESMEREMKRRNVIIRGLKASGNEEAGKKVKELVKDLTNSEANVKNVKIIRTKIGEIIVAECESNEQKAILMKQKAKLKGRKEEEIYINDDMTVKEREIQRKGRELANNLRKDGAEVKTGYKKIIKNGKVLIWSNLKNDFVEKI